MEAKLGSLCKRGHDDDGYGHSLRDKHGGCIACRKVRYETNKEEVLRYNKEYWKRIPKEKRREYDKRYEARHPEKVKEARRDYYRRNKERFKEYWTRRKNANAV